MSPMNAIKRAAGIVTRPEKLLYTSGILSTHRLSLPDFLGIGLPRAGTTWLYRNLSGHPDIYFPAQKEQHFFNRHFQRTLRSYSRQLEGAGGDQIKGEITPDYAYLSQRRIRFIAKLIPDVRLILLLRHPVDRAWSDIVRVLATRTATPASEIPTARFIEYLSRPAWRSRNDYLRVLDAWCAEFSPDQLYVGLMEEIHRDPKGLLEGVCRHLGITDSMPWEQMPLHLSINTGTVKPIPEEVRQLLEQLCCDQIERLVERLGDDVSSWLCTS